LSALAQDFRFAFRVLRKNPGYTLVALLTLALGIGANTAIFSLVHGVLLRPLPYPEPDRLVRVFEVNERGGRLASAWPNFADWRERSSGFASLTAHTRGGESTVLGTGTPLRVGTAGVSEAFLRTLGVTPALGRDFVADEHREGADPAVIVSHRFWRSYLGSDPQIADRRLEVAGVDARIVGVASPDFDYPSGIDVWYPIELTPQGTSRTAHNYVIVGRLRDGVTLDAADGELDVITARFLEEDPSASEETWFEEFFPRSARVVPLQADLIGDTSRPLAILLGASVLLLLVACTNLASTGLARGMRRGRELAVRQALGAGRRRLVRLLFAEAIGLSLAGAVLGIGLAVLILEAVPILAPDALPPFARFGLHPAVLAFTFAIAGVTALLFGLAPALRHTRGEFAPVLKGGGRGGPGQARAPLWRALIASEVALSLVLLIGCGLLIRSFYTVLAIEPGFRIENVLLATMSPPATKYVGGAERARLYESILGELERQHGVAAVGLVAAPPMGGIPNGMVSVDGGPNPAVIGDYQLASSGYFDAMEIPLLRGRLFESTDRTESEHVVVVNRAFAELAWPGEDPIGKRMTAGGMDDYWDQDKWATVVGLVGDIRQQDLTRPPEPTYYFSYSQRPFRSWAMTAVVRPDGAARPDLGPLVRDLVRAVDPDVPVTLSTIEMRVSRVVAQRRFTLVVLAAFAVVALLLACIGIYGVVAYAVALRTREIGIRIALGAKPASVRRLVQKDTLADVVLGGIAGLVLAFGLARVMRSLLYEVSPTDPLTFAGVVVALGAAGWLAAYVPARRSTRIDPVTTMRAE